MFPENEEGLPEGWDPCSAERVDKSESVVSIFSGWSMKDIAWYSPLPSMRL
jgi:hypothetical protein